MANNNSGGRERRKPGIQALPEERKRGVTIRFLPEMKDDIYDLRDLLEREGPKGKKLVSQILKHQGKIDDLLAKIKGNKKEEETGFPPLPNYENLKKGDEVEALQEENQRLREMLAATNQEKAELEELRRIASESKKLFSQNMQCLDNGGRYVGDGCQTFYKMKNLLAIN
jgi:predicted  nucleic acid-binding Zn-ribbon protein